MQNDVKMLSTEPKEVDISPFFSRNDDWTRGRHRQQASIGKATVHRYPPTASHLPSYIRSRYTNKQQPQQPQTR